MHGLLLAVGLGTAAAQPVEVIWTGDASCSQAHFQASLDEYLTSVVVAEPLRVEVQTHWSDRGGWTLTLTFVGVGGRSVRQLRGPSCASVSDAAAFVTAVVVDPTVLERARPLGAAGAGGQPPTSGAAGGEGTSGGAGSGAVRPPETGPSAAVPPAPADQSTPAGSGGRSTTPATAALAGSGPQTATSGGRPSVSLAPLAPGIAAPGAISPVPHSARSAAGEGDPLEVADPLGSRAGPVVTAVETDGQRAGPRGFVRVAGGMEAVGSPGIGGQVQVAAGPVGRTWRVELRGLYRAPSRALALDNPAVGGRIGLWTVGGQGCGVLRPSILEIPLCAGVEVGRAHGMGFGFPGAQSTYTPWVGVTVGAALAWAPRRWLALWFGVELVVPVLRGRFDIGGLGEVHQIGPVSPRAALGIELRFP